MNNQAIQTATAPGPNKDRLIYDIRPAGENARRAYPPNGLQLTSLSGKTLAHAMFLIAVRFETCGVKINNNTFCCNKEELAKLQELWFTSRKQLAMEALQDTPDEQFKSDAYAVDRIIALLDNLNADFVLSPFQTMDRFIRSMEANKTYVINSQVYQIQERNCGMRDTNKTAKRKTAIITIDGPVASGKTSTAKALARRLNFTYIDTGAVYRTIALYTQEHDGRLPDLGDPGNIHIDILGTEQKMFIHGVPVKEDTLRTPEISDLASVLSERRAVRDIANELIREVAKNHDIVVEGRDTGSVLFQQANLKVYLTADPYTRAKRRAKDWPDYSVLEIELKNKTRDERDMNRKLAPLKKTRDMVQLDNTLMDLEQTIFAIQMLWADARPVYAGTITITQEQAGEIDKYLTTAGLQPENKTIVHTIEFENQHRVDIRCTASKNETSHAEAILFDPNGLGIYYSEPGDTFTGTWELETDTARYTVDVKIKD